MAEPREFDWDPREWGRDVWLMEAMPSPAWVRYASIPDSQWYSERPFMDAVEATRTALAFLEAAGMRSLPDRKGTGFSDHGVLLGWSSDTIVVIAALATEGTLGLLVVEVEGAPSTLEALIDWARRRTPVLVPFGAFWLVGADRAALDHEIGSYMRLFREAIGPDPLQRDLGHLRSTLAAHERRLAAERMVPWLLRRAEDAWDAGHWALYLDVTDDLAHHGEPPDAERRSHAWAQLADVVPPPAWPPTIEGIRFAADRLNDAHRALHRGGSEDLPWVARLIHGRLVTAELWDAVERLRVGDPTAVEPVLVFLEADPWAFRTGYLKERIMARLRRCPLDPGQQDRLRAVLLHLVDVGGRLEYRQACRLAWRVADPAFMAALRTRADGTDPGIARRAGWMLAAIRPPAGT